MEKTDVRFGEWMTRAWQLYKANFVVLILASLIGMLLSAVTVGVLAGPMAAGMVLIVLRLLDGDATKPQPGDVFQGFTFFVQTLLYLVVWGAITFAGMAVLNVIPCVGQLLALAGVYALQAFLMFALFLIVDRKMDFWPASMESIQVVKANFLPFLGLALLAFLLGGVGAVACGLGMFLTMPFCFCLLAVAYREVFGGTAESGEPGEAAAPQVRQDEPEDAAQAPEEPPAGS